MGCTSSTADASCPKSACTSSQHASKELKTALPACTSYSGSTDSAKILDLLEQILNQLDVTTDGKLVSLGRRDREDDLNAYSLFRNVSLSTKRALVEMARHDPRMDSAMGSMCGMAIGDALGHPFEFMPAQNAPTRVYFDLPTFTFHGESNAFGLQRGQWTDDASMGLCIADSLLVRRAFDGGDVRVRFWCWWNRGYNNAFRKDRSRTSSVGLGGNISDSLSALSRVRRGEKVPPTYDVKAEDAGNGSLMRFTPMALFLHESSDADVYHYSRMSSYTTHPGIVAAEACSLLGHLIVRAMRLPVGAPRDARTFLDQATEEYMSTSGLATKSGWGYDQMKWLVTSKPIHDTELCWNWKSRNVDIMGTLRARGASYNGYPVSAGYFGSYALDGLALALWAVYNSSSFDEAVTKSVNLLGDADSHGSIAGQLAGAIYGYSSIHPKFLEWLVAWDDYEFAVRGALLHFLGSRTQA
eukprot:TRINITY_DN48645_c0_g1_i1.p1 TRINITY_DN48645_c0_g1~~TRINITY_DN48645_c0_g1_i1.p1  ORF type:complete len:517 (-),score=55.22 TRINITY_DN48645_c0_g1_i1:146-1555(-)